MATKKPRANHIQPCPHQCPRNPFTSPPVRSSASEAYIGTRVARRELQHRSDPLRVALSAQSEPDGCGHAVGSYEPHESRDVHEEPEAVHACCSGLSFE